MSEDLIRRSDVLKEAVWLETEVPSRAAPLRTEIIRANDVKSIPAVDAVEVVRCNQCVFYEGVHGVQGHAPCKCWNSGGVVWNDYCSYGMTKEDVDEAHDVLGHIGAERG